MATTSGGNVSRLYATDWYLSSYDFISLASLGLARHNHWHQVFVLILAYLLTIHNIGWLHL